MSEMVWDKELPIFADRRRVNIITDDCRDIRLSLGLFYTDMEYEKYRKNILKKKLP